MKKIAKTKSGTSLGMKSVKAGYDNNTGITKADIISAGKMNAGKAKNGKTMMAKKGASVKSSGMHKMPDGSMMKNSKMKSGGAVKAKTGIKKMMSGGKCKMGC